VAASPVLSPAPHDRRRVVRRGPPHGSTGASRRWAPGSCRSAGFPGGTSERRGSGSARLAPRRTKRRRRQRRGRRGPRSHDAVRACGVGRVGTRRRFHHPPGEASSVAWRHAACALARLSMAQRTDPNTRTGSTGRLVPSAGCAPQCVESTTCAVIAPWPTRAHRIWPRRGSYPCEQHVRNRRASPWGPDRMSSHREAHVRVDGSWAAGSDGQSLIRALGWAYSDRGRKTPFAGTSSSAKPEGSSERDGKPASSGRFRRR
jgi:hypothetical protein